MHITEYSTLMLKVELLRRLRENRHRTPQEDDIISALGHDTDVIALIEEVLEARRKSLS